MKRTQLLVLLLCAAATGGCTHTHNVGYEASQTSPESMIRFLKGKSVTVTTADSMLFEGTFLAAVSDTARLQLSGTHVVASMPFRRIVMIEVAGNALGPLVGFVGGGVACGLAGGAIGAGSSGSDGVGSVDENMGALIGGIAGAALGATIGANVTAGDRYLIPTGGVRITKPADTVTVQVDRILRETEESVTFRWFGGTTTLPRAHLSIDRRTEGIFIRAPRSLLYDDNEPRYFDEPP